MLPKLKRLNPFCQRLAFTSTVQNLATNSTAAAGHPTRVEPNSAFGAGALAVGSRFRSVLLLLFCASGCAALIYELVWFQMLELVIGSSAVSLGVLLGTFMGGMCLGSILFSRGISPRFHSLRVWACLEAGIGIFGVAVFFAIPSVGHFYSTSAAHGTWSLVLRGVICAICLLPPTMLMGATLPALSRYLDSTARGVSSGVGLFYAGNITGAVFGSLLAGFWLLRLYETGTATFTAVLINASISVAAALLAAELPGSAAPPQVCLPVTAVPGSWRIFLTIGISGFCALGAEVVWTRLLSLLLGPTVYAFAIILAVFLAGLGLGSATGAFLGRKSLHPAILLGWSQLLLVLAIAWTAWTLSRSLPYWSGNAADPKSMWAGFQHELIQCVFAILPATCLWGASFPLALAAATGPGQDPAHLVGRVYAANTIGAIAGALACSLVLVAWVGTQNTQRLLAALSVLSGFVMLFPLFRPSLPVASERAASWRVIFKLASGLGVFTTALLVAGIIWSIPKIPSALIAFGHKMKAVPYIGTMLYVGEGINASVAVSETSNGTRLFHIGGKVEASTSPTDMGLQRMLGHIPALFHREPRSVLVVGCGAGVTAGSFVTHPAIERIVICEIEPLIPKAVTPYFKKENHDVLHDPRVSIVYDDARHFILTSREKFDIITSDPIHPWVKGAASLYTREYFELCQAHLNPGGLITQWVPLYESNSRAIKSTMATFFSVFPHATVWSNDDMGEGYDLVLLGQTDPLEINIDELQRRLHSPGYRRVESSLADVGIKSAFGLLTTYAGQATDLTPWLYGAEINHDRDLRLQYLAGTRVNIEAADDIYGELLRYRRFPTETFRGASTWTHALAKIIDHPTTAPAKK